MVTPSVIAKPGQRAHYDGFYAELSAKRIRVVRGRTLPPTPGGGCWVLVERTTDDSTAK